MLATLLAGLEFTLKRRKIKINILNFNCTVKWTNFIGSGEKFSQYYTVQWEIDYWPKFGKKWGPMSS